MASNCPLPSVGADVIRSATGPTWPADTLRPLLVLSFRNSMHLQARQDRQQNGGSSSSNGISGGGGYRRLQCQAVSFAAKLSRPLYGAASCCRLMGYKRTAASSHCSQRQLLLLLLLLNGVCTQKRVWPAGRWPGWPAVATSQYNTSTALHVSNPQFPPKPLTCQPCTLLWLSLPLLRASATAPWCLLCCRLCLEQGGRQKLLLPPSGSPYPCYSTATPE